MKTDHYGIQDIIARCAPQIEAGARPATTIFREIERERVLRGFPDDDWPVNYLTQVIEKHFRCHTPGWVTAEEISQEQDLT